jgi:hypothetical protein
LPLLKYWKSLFKEIVENVDRRGLDKEILLYRDMVLDGWHRYLACLATKTKPKFTEFQGTDLEAAEIVHASGIRRQLSADQRYACFLLLCGACPAFKEKYEQLKTKAELQQKAGAPLVTSSQRVDVAKAKAGAAGVSKATANKVERVKKVKPDAVAEIAAGRTTANKELKTLAGKGNKGGSKEKRKQTPPEKPASRTKAPALNCTVQLELVPVEHLTLGMVVDRLLAGEAVIQGLHVWQGGAKRTFPEPGAALPNGCLATVTGIRSAQGFKLEEES